MSNYDIIIGLEVHVQLQTATKLFCGCSTQFGAEPNTQTCPVCTGMPGTLPVMNRKAFDLAVRTALALNCQIAPFTKWDRKQYYYPDLPKGYQISQFDLPFSHDGWLEISDPKGKIEPKRLRIQRVHLEEDAGKSMHDEVAGSADSRIDLNRTGTPLLEIVTQPDMRSPAEAKAFLTELKLLLTYLGVSDCNMQEGSLRVDGNINLHVHTDAGKIATPIVEVKNMNSFRSVERALTYEAERLWDVWQESKQKLGDVPKQTRGWDDQANITRGQRHKEESSDYRYFPDPDLVPVTVSSERVAEVQSGLGELPAALRTRLETSYGITPYDSDVIVNQGRAAADYYLAVADGVADGKLASNWFQQDVLRTLNDRSLTIEQFGVPATALVALLKKIKGGELDNARGRQVFAAMLDQGLSADAAMQALGFEQVDESELVALCQEIVAANPKIVADVKGGNAKAAGSFVGMAKKKNKNVNPARVQEICLQLIAQM
ncbi:MAG: Asp-tRNA(Asn)/Glu-tRNA(Gln) amidotransferase subunit GatB [Planctomycetaceae bacterium]|nr:Asp-tRNA(Asn)/Glu-tRNA(Gln) amidotransferase subunit GatB [Planctomycetaceae bacterium]